MDKFSAAEMLSFFRQFCPDVEAETLEIIRSEKISGKRAIKLDLLGWKSVGISYGEAVDIVGAIESFQSGGIQFDCNAVRENFSIEVNEKKKTSADTTRFAGLNESNPKVQQGDQLSLSNSLSKSNPLSNRFPLSSEKENSHFPASCGNLDASSSKSYLQPTISSDNAAGSSAAPNFLGTQIFNKTNLYQPSNQTAQLNDLESSDIDQTSDLEERLRIDLSEEEASTDFSSIEKYFKPSDFKEMSNYEKEAYLCQQRNYERGLSMPGLTVLKMPAFMQTAETVKRSGNPRKPAAKVNLKNQSSGSSSNSQLDPPCAKSSRTLRSHFTASPGDTNASCSKSASQPTTSSDSASGLSLPGTSSGNVVRPSKKTNSNQALEFNDFSDGPPSEESETPSVSEPAKKKRKRRKNNRSENISEEAFSAKLPKVVKELAGSLMQPFSEAEKERIRGTSDFLACNVYFGMVASYTTDGNSPASQIPLIGPFLSVMPFVNPAVVGTDFLHMNTMFSLVEPDAIRSAVLWAWSQYKLPLVISENGFGDIYGLGKKDRIRGVYHSAYLRSLVSTMKEFGIKVIGYCTWSLIDSFEWTAGYSRPFGLFHVDYEGGSLDRSPKDSSQFWIELAKTGSVPLWEDDMASSGARSAASATLLLLLALLAFCF